MAFTAKKGSGEKMAELRLNIKNLKKSTPCTRHKPILKFIWRSANA